MTATSYENTVGDESHVSLSESVREKGKIESIPCGERRERGRDRLGPDPRRTGRTERRGDNSDLPFRA
jgi:hypothetical protein